MICIQPNYKSFRPERGEPACHKNFPNRETRLERLYLRESGEEIRTAFRTQTATQAVRELEKT